MTARAVWWIPSGTISHSTPGDRNTIGSLVANTRRPPSSTRRRTGACANSGRGANSTTALACPLMTRIKSVRPTPTSCDR